ncbi:thiopurine S-methyltransferase [Rheinheimera riviphila]|uniref:Thiopurine S-methyltransferase n=1 Tax=Rheinheimera riviphila TaxID=1834037 RepID=A0A437R369_9GAMM|nr:thiopurine S-methyltransferase [Rheinheimera riviphila]RVU41211.1 thiopurine S-methyltransferase [Rheinheimera riviphila]
MEAEFWHQVWQQDQLGFQLEDAHPLLRAHFCVLPVADRIFVPLCGKSPDLRWLAQHCQVIGAELSAIACRDFFTESGLIATQHAAEAFQVWQAARYQLWQGDFFQLPAIAVQHCQLIYDRAAMIALPAAMRLQYATQLQTLFPAATMLLISLEYPEQEKQGPPFAVFETELRTLFPAASIALVAIRDLTGIGFARRKFATSRLLEKAWLIQWAEPAI